MVLFTPDLATPISKMKEVLADKGKDWPVEVQVGLIGSLHQLIL